MHVSGLTLIATEPTGYYWIGSAAFACFFLGLCGYLVRQAWRRHTSRQVEATAVHDRLPPELRMEPESPGSRALIYAALICLTVPAGLAFGGPGIAVAALVVVTPYVIWVERRRAARRHELMAIVKDRAGTSTDQELHELVDDLATEHGEFQIRHLRDLVPRGIETPANVSEADRPRITARGIGLAAMTVWLSLLLVGAAAVEGVHRRNILIVATIVGITLVANLLPRRL